MARVVEKAMESAPKDIGQFADIVDLFNKTTESLRVSHEKLSKKVEELQKELEEKNNQLRRKNRLEILGEMSACLAHEIRNPLGGIELYATLLRRECERMEKPAELAAKILSGVQSLNRLMEDMLTFTGKLEPAMEPVSVEELIDRALLFAAPKLEERSIVLTKRFALADATVRGDGSMLERVFLNIVVNAAQATEKGGAIAIRTEKKEGIVEAAFSDNGSGLSKEALEKLFTPFYTSKRSGTGLGLTIANRIVESHGGTIRAFNNESGGATFVVSLPIGQDSESKR